MSELAAQWYTILASLNSIVSGPLSALARNTTDFPFLSPVILGILGATAPCQLTTNAAALAYLARKIDDWRYALSAALAYLLGKVAVYTLAGGTVVLLGTQVADASVPTLVLVRKLLGPLMILLGLILLGVIRSNVSFGEGLKDWLRARSSGYGARGSFALGVAFALAFCPTLFWLFFGILIPLAVTSRGGILYPGFFALGTTIPLLALVGLLLFSAASAQGYIRKMTSWGKVIQRGAAIVFVLAGINDTITYWFV